MPGLRGCRVESRYYNYLNISWVFVYMQIFRNAYTVPSRLADGEMVETMKTWEGGVLVF
jgi:hypothetical protein